MADIIIPVAFMVAKEIAPKCLYVKKTPIQNTNTIIELLIYRYLFFLVAVIYKLEGYDENASRLQHNNDDKIATESI